MDNTGLKNILRDESSSALRALSPDFYASVDIYIRELEDEIKKINNPRSVESKMLEDELQSAINNIEDIFMLRIRKITTRATSHAFSNRSSKQDREKLLPAEQNVYDSVLSVINTARNELLEPILNPDAVQTGAETGQTIPDVRQAPIQNAPDVTISPSTDTPPPSAELVNDAGKKIGKSNINKEYVVVRILEDLPTFKAVDDRNYTLSAEDVVILPALNARGLVKRNAAQLVPDN